MPREVNSTQSYADKLVKLIPTEIVGAYMALSGIIGVSPASSSTPGGMSGAMIIVVSIILLALTPIYTFMDQPSQKCTSDSRDNVVIRHLGLYARRAFCRPGDLLPNHRVNYLGLVANDRATDCSTAGRLDGYAGRAKRGCRLSRAAGSDLSNNGSQ